MKNLIFILAIFTLSFTSKSQIISSSTYIQTCLNKKQCSSINSTSFLFYDESKSTIYLKIDFAGFKTGQDSLDDWLLDLVETALYFKAPMSSTVFDGLSNHNHKDIELHGQVYLNGLWKNQTINLSLFNTENSVLTTSTNGNKYDNYRVNFSLSIAPKDFKIHKKPHHLRKTIFIGIALGRINLYQQDNKPILQEVYDHH